MCREILHALAALLQAVTPAPPSIPPAYDPILSLLLHVQEGLGEGRREGGREEGREGGREGSLVFIDQLLYAAAASRPPRERSENAEAAMGKGGGWQREGRRGSLSAERQDALLLLGRVAR
jgi:hypothetical protein